MRQDIMPPERSRQGYQVQRAPGLRTLSYRPERTFYSRRTRFDVDSIEVLETYETEPAPMTRGIEHLSAEAKVFAMDRALRTVQKDLKAERRKRRDLRRFGLVFIASVFVLVTGYVSLDTIITNNQVKAEDSRSTAPSSQQLPNAAQEGRDETVPAANILSSYIVSPNKPRALYIDGLSIAARVLPMNINDKGAIESPRNIFDSGWYTGSVEPDEEGAVFIDGHASGPSRKGLFAYLDSLKEGDTIQLEKGNGSKLTYKVVRTDIIALTDIDMKKVLQPYEGVKKGLNLMTCTGSWMEDDKTYDKRVIVWADQV